MKKRLSFALILILLISFVPQGYAGTPQLSDTLFGSAKEALRCLASGEYERLVAILPFSGYSPSADEWRSFAQGNFSTLNQGVQTEYAVAYWNGGHWKLAIPLETPSRGDVEVFLLQSQDGQTFCGYQYGRWANVYAEVQAAEHVTWNREYTDTSLVISFD